MQANPHQMVKDGRMQPVPVIPDYSGANLTGIIPGCLLGTSGRRPNWFPQPLQEAERIVLLVIDGLGYEQLQRHAHIAPNLMSLLTTQVVM